MIQKARLENGISLIHWEVDSAIAHLGLYINTGSRDEPASENGIAHFIEHVIFKGTKKRKAFHILNRLDSVGGDLNAFTTKEITCIYATFMNQYYDRTAELISDLAFNSVFPARELEKEKDVIIDEINSYKDTPYEMIYDDFEEFIFKGHPLGRNILGKPETVRKITRKDILDFFADNYNTDQMVICSVGKISFTKIKGLAEKYYAQAPAKSRNTKRKVLNKYKPFDLEEKKKTYQAHCMLGSRAFQRSHPKRLAMVLVNNYLGGPGLNSRLNLMIREKYGFTYQIESFYNNYSDAGIWGVYMGTTNNSVDKTIELVHKELKKLRDKKLGTLQLNSAKTQLIGQLAISYESNLNKMFSTGRSYLMEKKIYTIESINEKIKAITAGEILELSNEVFDVDRLSMLKYTSE